MIHGLFVVVNNGEVPNCDKIQQLICNICFPHVVPPLIEKKTKGKKRFIAYNKFCGTGSMKHYVEALHLKLLTTYVVECFVHDNVTSSQKRSDEGGSLMQPTKKCTKVVPKAISYFFGSKTPYKRHDEAQQLFLKDLVLLTIKCFSFGALVKMFACVD
jgi:hypothetical protein